MLHVHAYMYTRTYVLTFVRMYVGMYVCMYIHTHARARIYMLQGYYREKCPGNTRQDTPCLPCTIGGCGYNEYRPTCDGLFSTADSECKACSTVPCMDTKQIRPICDGSVDTQDSVCTNCQRSCGPGEYIISACTVPAYSGFVCGQCRAGCAFGERLSGLCNGKGYADVTCLPCKERCAEGQYMTSLCTGTTVQVCMCVQKT
jgi:hypothetical protein